MLRYDRRMDLNGLLHHRIGGGLAAIRVASREAAGDAWGFRLSPSSNTVGWTLWHSATIVDWTVNAFIRGREEVRSAARWMEAGVGTGTMPLGMEMAEADAIAARVVPDELGEYTRAVFEDVGPWIDGLTSEALEAVPPSRENLAAYPAEQTDTFWEEVDWMLAAPVWELLARPCLGHVFVHYGEVEAALEAHRSD